MTFSSGASETGFSFSGWSAGGGTIWHTSLGTNATVSKNSGTWDFTSFTTAPFAGTNNYQVTSNLGHSYTFTGASATHSLSWTGVTTVTFLRTSGSAAAEDFDNFV